MHICSMHRSSCFWCEIIRSYDLPASSSSLRSFLHKHNWKNITHDEVLTMNACQAWWDPKKRQLRLDPNERDEIVQEQSKTKQFFQWKENLFEGISSIVRKVKALRSTFERSFHYLCPKLSCYDTGQPKKGIERRPIRALNNFMLRRSPSGKRKRRRRLRSDWIERTKQ